MTAHGGNRRKCKKCLRQWGFLMIGGAWRTLRNKVLAEREGFEPPIRLPVCRISSAVLSTTQPPLQTIASTAVFRFTPGGKTADGRQNGHQNLFRAPGYHKPKRRVDRRRLA